MLFNFVFVDRRKIIWLLVISSLIFYGTWNYNFIALLVFSALADYLIAQKVEANNHDPVMKKRLIASITLNLSILAIFKYNNFILQSVQEFVSLFGGDISVPMLSIILPVGISFYTFQSMSYTIDVYRGDMKAHRGFLVFLATLSFFPQLVAGPILRAKEILPQLVNMRVPTALNIRIGLLLVLLGLLKKTTADLMAGPVGVAFNGQADVSTFETWIGLLAFSAQLYGDFSGYSDIAIGIALMLGVYIPMNFNLPYFSTSPVDFWRRWHISLSSWLRDYLYISLGGSRNGKRARNQFITMLLAGLWHGASWTFVVWGAYMGVIVVVTQWLNERPALAKWVNSKNWLSLIIKIAVTHYLFVLSWPLFRGSSLEAAWTMIVDMHIPQETAVTAGAGIVMALVVAGLFLMHFVDALRIRYGDALANRQWFFWPLLVIGFTLFFTVGDFGHDFIYFQF
ncbi:Probable poly(beta-D-mannuronate) O-acetylase [hydrothermal vent metagenome]|uniref:Probable poly(Beta-D-mannuronate) O-acetylase n=2 Tax=root TaxID=1 RepID=A0A160TFE6_9ZZZZ